MSRIRTIGTIFCTDSIPETTVKQVRDALNDSGLDKDIANELSARFCFVRAKNRLRERGVINEVSEDATRWTFQLDKTNVENEKLSYLYEAQFWFDKESEQLGSDSAELLVKANELFKHYGETYLPSDTSKLVRRIFDNQGGMVKLRHSGAVYFVPEENRPLLEKIQLFANALGFDCITADVGGENVQVRNKTIEMLTESVKADFDNIVKELKDLKESSTPLTPRKAKARWNKLVAEIARIKTFARSLQVDTTAILNGVKTTEFDLALVSECTLDVLATLAQHGKLDNALGQIAKCAFEGDLPPIDCDRVAKVAAGLAKNTPLADVGGPDLPVVAPPVRVGARELVDVA